MSIWRATLTYTLAAELLSAEHVLSQALASHDGHAVCDGRYLSIEIPVRLTETPSMEAALRWARYLSRHAILNAGLRDATETGLSVVLATDEAAQSA